MKDQTVLAYERDPYLKELRTDIISVEPIDEGFRVVTTDTVLYPAGGGQPSDQGRIDGFAVLRVVHRDGQLVHVLDQAPVTGPVTISLDWDRRFDHMQQHTGQHLLSAVAQREFGWATTSFHLHADVSDIELDTPEVTPEDLSKLERCVAEEIRSARPVVARRIARSEYDALQVRTRGLPADHTGDIRLIEIEGIDLTTCGGTHVRSTAELQSLALVGSEPLRGGSRLHFVVGNRVRRRLGHLEKIAADLRGILASENDQLAEVIRLKLEQLAQAQRQARRFMMETARYRAERLVATTGGLADDHFEEMDLRFLQVVGREAIRLAPEKVVFLTCGREEKAAFVLAAAAGSGVSVAEIGPEVAELLGGRGGGSGVMFQGKARSLDARPDVLALLGRRSGYSPSGSGTS